jgi:hypothetical protein
MNTKPYINTGTPGQQFSGASSGSAFNPGSAMFLSSIFSAIGSIYAGKATSDIAKYNAMVIEARQELIKVKQDIEFGRYVRGMGTYLSQATTAAGGAGIMPSGSYAAVANRSITQMMIDQAIGQFDFEIQKSDVQAQAQAVRNQGKDAQRGSYVRAFSQIMSGAKDYALYTKGIDTDKGAKSAGRQT